MHGPISKEKLKPAFTSLLDSRETERLVMSIDPLAFRSDENVQAAIVALQDAVVSFQCVRYSLVEAEAHLAFFGRDNEDNPSPAGLFHAQFYLDDACLRLPRAADFVANTLILYLGVPAKDIRSDEKEPGGLSQRLAGWLAKHLQDSSIARAFQRLYESDDWRFVVAHREAWLRGEAIRIQGTDLAYSLQVGWDLLEPSASGDTGSQFKAVPVNPVVRRSQLEFPLSSLLTRSKGGYNAMVTLLHSVYEDLARSAAK